MHISDSREILILEENFAYLLPCDNLKNFISNFTITFPDSTIISDDYTIMPHGSVTLVLFYYKAELHSFLFGPTTKPVKVGDLANKCSSIFIIEFQPAGFYPFKKITQNELTDRILPFSLIDAPLDSAMRRLYKTSLSVDELLLGFEKELLQSILFTYPRELALSIKVMVQMDGVVTSDAIAKKCFYSPRHLNRLFNQYLGMSMKSFSRLVRINKSFRLLNERTNTLAVICEKLGYYDVSHFVKDFKVVCNITPEEYKVNMSDFYSEIAKF